MLLTVGHNWSGAGASDGVGGLFCWDVVQLNCVRRIKVDSYDSVTLHNFLNTSHGFHNSIHQKVLKSYKIIKLHFGLIHKKSLIFHLRKHSIQYLITWYNIPQLSKLHQIFMSPSKLFAIDQWWEEVRYQGTSCWHGHV